MTLSQILAWSKRKLSSLVPILIPLNLFFAFLTGTGGEAQLVGRRGNHNQALSLLASGKQNPVISPSLQGYLSRCRPDDSVRIWVFFTDKGIFSEAQFEEAKAAFGKRLSNSALRKRLKNDAAIDFSDLPVDRNYIDEILKIGGRLRQSSRWLNAVSFQIQAPQLQKVADLPFVKEIKKVASYTRTPDETISIRGRLCRPEASAGYGRNYGPSLAQLEQINVPIVHDTGYKGQNVIVCMMDTGYRKDHHAFAAAYAESRVLAEYDFIFHDTNTQNQSGDTSIQQDHGTETWSTLGGEFDGQLYGPAYGASFVLAKTEDVRSETPIEEDNWVAGIEWADSLGAEVVSSSLGYTRWDDGTGYTYQDMDGNTTLCTKAADLAASKGIVVANAAGNERKKAWHYIVAPADGDSVIAVGAVDADGIIADFSSVGPTYDGRTKPEVVARGVLDYFADPYDVAGYAQGNGTSYSTPLVGGCAAVLLSAHPDWTAMQVREALIMTAKGASAPNNTYGWGLVNLFAALYYSPSGALSIQHDPLLFASDTSNPYVLSAVITPGHGLKEDSLFVYWRADTLSPFTRQHLQSLGSHHYQAEIPGQSAGSIVYYYLSAQDTLNNVVTLPLGAPAYKFKFYIDTDFITFDFEDGLFHWETGGTNNTWNITSASAHSGKFSLTDSPQGGYQNNTDSWAGIQETFSLVDAQDPQLSFWHWFQFSSGDTGFVEITTGGVKGWERIGSGYTGSESQWTQVNLPLDVYVGQSNVRFRFHFTSDNAGTADGWYIDDVQINFKPTSVEEQPSSAPQRFCLYQNYPNPFNPSTMIRFNVQGSRFKVPIPTTLTVYNLLGQRVRTVLDEPKTAGDYEVIWDGRDDGGKEMASGIYFYQLRTGDFTATKKMVLLK
ncbi:MAG: S8 family serine peptidase [Candidatus Zixiibacteriota bacterium]